MIASLLCYSKQNLLRLSDCDDDTSLKETTRQRFQLTRFLAFSALSSTKTDSRNRLLVLNIGELVFLRSGVGWIFERSIPKL